MQHSCLSHSSKKNINSSFYWVAIHASVMSNDYFVVVFMYSCIYYDYFVGLGGS